MSLLSLTLVVLAAFIHATWNLLSKRAADAGPTFVFAYNLFACLVYLPWMIWLLVYGDLHWSLPVAGCLVLSACIHLGLQPLPAARLSGRRPLGGLSDRARHRAAAVVDRRIHPAARDADRAGHLRAARRRRRDRLHHHAGRSLGVPPPARPRWRALGHRDRLADRGLHRRRRIRRQAARHSPGRARLGHQFAALLHHAADRAVEPASREGEDERLLAGWPSGSARCRRCPTSSCCQPSRWAPRSAWSRPRAKCR